MKIVRFTVVFVAGALLLTGVSLAQSTTEIKGCIADVGPPPGHWAGLLSSEQAVDYEVLEVRSGSLSARKVRVLHAVVAPGGNIDATEPKLDEDIFAVGNVVVVEFLGTTDPVSGDTVYRNVEPVTLLSEHCVPGDGSTSTGGGSWTRTLVLGVLAALVVLVIVLLILRRRSP